MTTEVKRQNIWLGRYVHVLGEVDVTVSLTPATSEPISPSKMDQIAADIAKHFERAHKAPKQ